MPFDILIFQTLSIKASSESLEVCNEDSCIAASDITEDFTDCWFEAVLTLLIFAAVLVLAHKHKKSGKMKTPGKTSTLKKLPPAKQPESPVKTVTPRQLPTVRDPQKQLHRTLRRCVTNKLFKEGLAAYAQVANSIGRDCNLDDREWSMLLWCAKEVGAWSLCKEFYGRLDVTAPPNSYDVVNMTRCYAHLNDLEGLHRLLQSVRGVGYDNFEVVRHRAACACIEEGNMEFAEVLVASDAFDKPPEATSYNLLIKGYANRGQLQRCFEIFRRMQVNGPVPSDFTYGTLINACIVSQEFDQAQNVFNYLQKSGLPVNVVHYTTLMKGFVDAGHVEKATAVFNEMQASGTQPDLVTYKTLLRGWSKVGNVEAILKALMQMKACGDVPDQVVCFAFKGIKIHCGGPANAKDALTVFLRHGFRMTTSSLSLFIKALTQHKAFSEALKLLENVPDCFGLQVEEHVFVQLATALHEAGERSRIIEVCSLMSKAAQRRNEEIDNEAFHRILSACC